MMPSYTYKCRQCGQTMDDVVQSMDDAPYVRISHEADGQPCQGEVFRVIGRAAVQYKGHGFHRTDYSRK